MSLPCPVKTMENALRRRTGASEKTIHRLARLLVCRAVRFYIEGSLDDATIQDDLYKENGKYVNLIYSEKYAREWAKEQRER